MLSDQHYLDNTGAALYPENLIKEVSDDFRNNIYMNPHSDIYSHKCVDNVRKLILQHFNTNTDEYCVIFTSGATQSLKLLAESFQFNNKRKRGAFVHLCDNHTSVLGLREIVKANKVDIFYIPHENFLKTLSYSDDDGNNDEYKECSKNGVKNGRALFAYPAQNNFNGFKYPINSTNRIKNGCLNKYVNKGNAENNYTWYVLLDAASFVSTSRLDLNKVKPDFICLSFYKIFGYPTGLGALLVRNNCKYLLNRKKYYGGGTVDTVLNTDTFFARKEDFSERFEDGTVSFLSILALKHCFKILNDLIPATINYDIMDTINYHVFYLGKDLYARLKELKYENGRQAIEFYMDSDFTDIKKQGGVVTFNIVRKDGSFVGYNEFQKKAGIYNICVRSGCFCNSGSCQRHFKLSNKEIKDRYKAGHKCGGETDLINGIPTGAVRVSFGYYNTRLDIDQLMIMIFDSFLHPFTLKRNIGPNLITEEKLKSFKHTQITLEDNSVNNKESNKLKIHSNFTLREIVIYPIEQCGPYKIKSNWTLCDEGLLYDRKWRIKSENGTFLNYSQICLMSKITPKINLLKKRLILHMQGMKSISVPLSSEIPKQLDEEKNYEQDCGDEVASWISEAVKCPNLRLVKLSKELRKTKLIDKQINLFFEQTNIVLFNNPPMKQCNDIIIISKFNHDEDINDTLLNTVKGNLLVEMPQEVFNGNWDRVTIDNHEFKVESRYYQSIEHHQNSILNPAANFTKDRVLAINLSYVQTKNNVTKTLKVNSQVNLHKPDIKIEEKSNFTRKSSLFVDSKNKITKILKYISKKRKKYEVNEL